jgi:DNA polymerase-1
VVDLETASAKVLFTTTQSEDFVRLAGALSLGSGETVITSVRELLARLESADVITGHNILGFDLLALAWHHGADYTRLAAKARDTELLARQANPPRSRETHSADSYDLDHVAERLGLPGKTDDLKRLAREHGGYDKIPLGDPEYRSYLEGDLRATAAVSAAMRERYPHDPYMDREHKLAALAGTMSLNGFLVDQELLGQRMDETSERSRTALVKLHDALGLPLVKTVMRGRGKARHEELQEQDSPLSTDEGRAWLERTWTEFGVTDPPRTVKTGKLSVGSDDLRAVAARRPDLAGLCEMIITAAWPRTVYVTARDCLCPDGRVHPGVSMRQASGRWSVTNPGLTVFGKRGGRHHERAIFLPDPGHVLLSFDLSQVDMRAMAGHSQDPGYMALFEPGKDAHAEIAAQVGVERQDAKAVGHGWNYGLGAKRMIANGLDEGLVTAFIAGMQQRFPRLVEWREEIRARGKAGEILDNGFGRRMRCDPARAYTVAPALMGQGGARDIMCESLLRIPREFDQYMRVMVHDEILLSVPKKDAMEVARIVKQAMTWNWRGVPILCDMAAGTDWAEVSAK